jgi:hypothetical protein
LAVLASSAWRLASRQRFGDAPTLGDVLEGDDDAFYSFGMGAIGA